MKTVSPTGGQSIPAFDHYMAPGVAKSFVKELVRVMADRYLDDEDSADWLLDIKRELRNYREEHRLIMNEDGYEFIRKLLNNKIGCIERETDRLIKKAIRHTNRATYQAMEALVHNLNSMHSRAGGIKICQAPELWETLGAAV